MFLPCFDADLHTINAQPDLPILKDYKKREEEYPRRAKDRDAPK